MRIRFHGLWASAVALLIASAPVAAQEALPALPATAAAPSGPIAVGTAIFVEWNGQWYNATVLAGPSAEGAYQIHYTGWGNEWDEWAAIGRIRVTAAPVACPPGQAVQVLWQGSWYGATFVSGPDAVGRCFITYDGYGSEWDEWVGEDRMRR